MSSSNPSSNGKACMCARFQAKGWCYHQGWKEHSQKKHSIAAPHFPSALPKPPAKTVYGEPVAYTRMREARALGERLDREAREEKATGKERARW